MNKLLFCALFCACLSASAQTFSFKSNEGSIFLMNESPGGKARVYYFLSPECPLCQSYSLTIRNIYAEFAKQGIEMVGIIPGNDFSNKDILEYEIKYKIPLMLLRDEQLMLVKKYNVTITPEVVLVNTQGKVIYQGRIDNWAYELGKKRKVITEYNLKDALTSVLLNKPISVSKTKAVGCYIE
ncbi:MAG TPA: alkyl hydroperoxide reductase [Bacteroidetes bacterium]|jgi:peroxiredoxin|nr:alkyl hydroperoxide reductase [Bacteroidota bacterium]